MSTKTADPWPRMRGVVNAVVTSLRSGSFIEETLESLCVQLGARSAWSTLETKAGGRIHRSRSASFGTSPLALAKHVTEVLAKVQSELRTVAGPVPYAAPGSFAGVPLWSHPTASDRTLIGSMYVEFPKDEATHDAVVEFLECVGTLLGGAIVQQTLIEETQESLLVERAKDHNEHCLRLDELLAPDSMAGIRHELMAAIDTKASIMILGESGTGKTHLATAFGRASRREPIVRAMLGQADDLNTITSELFGHERGAFSGAVGKRKGLVEYANGGTLILDEVLSLPAHAQQLLLDFTQFGSYRPLGYEGREPKRADLRLISVTNGDITQAISDDRFREDLYYRLATVPLVLPPLRERRNDIPQIAVCYLNSTDARKSWEIDRAATDLLSSPRLEWRGNIRELEVVL
jgi:transcriptional regulator with GAF, ATPase, and Fis domain